eukprot:g73078.t1
MEGDGADQEKKNLSHRRSSMRRRSSIAMQNRYIHLKPSLNVPLPSGEEMDSWLHTHQVCRDCSVSRGGREHRYPTNYISTTKYRLVTFPFQNLWEQLHKKANLYFFLIAVLSSTPLSPKPAIVAILPLLFVLSVTMAKEGVEDFYRYQMDKEINNRTVKAWRNQAWVDVLWRDLVVGDFVYLTENQGFPADICLLKTSLSTGTCTIDTSNLDGETNLKIRKAQPQSYNLPCEPDGLDYFRPGNFPACIIESSPPSKSLGSNAWTGALSWINPENSSSGPTGKTSLGMSQLLLRGCTLRSTRWIIGFVVMTGADTKLVLNSSPPKFKRSTVDQIVDRALYVIFGLQFSLCTLGAVMNYVWLNGHASDHWYLPYTYEGATSADFRVEAGFSWFTYLILLDIFVPISLYVSMEMVKIVQAYYINVDLEMYYAPTDTPAVARTSNLNEELGQVSYVFSDKTGTLTANVMNFIGCSVGGQAFGDEAFNPDHQQRHSNRYSHITPAHRPSSMPEIFPIPFTDKYLEYAALQTQLDHITEDSKQPGHLQNPSLSSPPFSKASDMQVANEFLTLLATCHTVMPDYPSCKLEHDHSTTCHAQPNFQAASLDERALVMAASNMQYFFYGTLPTKLSVGQGEQKQEIHGFTYKLNIGGKRHAFEVLAQFKFSSARARMGVVVRDPRDDRIKLYVKGSDTKVRSLLDKSAFQAAEDEKLSLWEQTNEHLTMMAAAGLRTLVCAYKVIPEPVFLAWYVEHRKAMEAVTNRENLIDSSIEALEQDLTLLGATAIEDKLQDGVPESIATLAQADMKIWVLTGDKVETAVNIGKSARLLTTAMQQRGFVMLNVDDELDDRTSKKLTLELLENAHSITSDAATDLDSLAVIVSGAALNHIFPPRPKHPITGALRKWTPAQQAEINDLQYRFNDVCHACKAVICCRVSPNQKAEIVQMVRKYVPKAVTLAIGDGANDVSMIKAAHVGIGVSGLEGLQAVMASDYAIGQFKFIVRLLLVHGQWSYRRITVLILYSFYKNAFIALLHVCFAFYSGFSGQIYYDAYIGSAYNIIFTSFPVMMAAIFNKETTAQSCIAYPKMYSGGARNHGFTVNRLLGRISLGMLQSIVFFFLTVLTYSGCSTEQDGYGIDHWTMSTASYSGAVLIVNVYIALETTTWTAVSVFFWTGSIAVWFLFFVVYAGMFLTPEILGVPKALFGTAHFWLVQMLGTVLCTIPHFAAKYIRRQYRSTLRDIVREKDAGYGRGLLDESEQVTNDALSTLDSHPTPALQKTKSLKLNGEKSEVSISFSHHSVEQTGKAGQNYTNSPSAGARVRGLTGAPLLAPDHTDILGSSQQSSTTPLATSRRTLQEHEQDSSSAGLSESNIGQSVPGQAGANRDDGIASPSKAAVVVERESLVLGRRDTTESYAGPPTPLEGDILTSSHINSNTSAAPVGGYGDPVIEDMEDSDDENELERLSVA